MYLSTYRETRLDPTSRGDIVATLVRHWYEANRETWWDRHCGPGWPVGPGTDRSGAHADEFILRFINKVREISKLSDMELVEYRS